MVRLLQKHMADVFFDEFSKSASIVTKLVDGKQVIAKIDGKILDVLGRKVCERSYFPRI